MSLGVSPLSVIPNPGGYPYEIGGLEPIVGRTHFDLFPVAVKS